MELPVLSTAMVQAFLICLARTGAIIASLPILGTGSTPARVKVMLTFVLTLFLYPMVGDSIAVPAFSPLNLGLLVASEAALGLMLGFTAQAIFVAVQMAGTTIGYQMGFAAANIFDPANNAQISLLAQFNNVFAVLLFFTLDIHYFFIRALVESFDKIPPGTVGLPGATGLYLMQLMSHSFVLSIKLAAPILALMMLTSLVLGIMSRVFPQLNAFMLSFPINIGVAFTVMGLTLSVVAALIQNEFISLEARFLQIFQSL